MCQINGLLIVAICIKVIYGTVSIQKKFFTLNDCGKGKAKQPLDIYWINLDYCVERRDFMSSQLAFYQLNGSYNHRVSGVEPNHIVHMQKLRNPLECARLNENDLNLLLRSDELRTSSNYSGSNWKLFLSGLCGRKKNTVKELTVTLSHLIAIREAIYDDSSVNQYALILEDDLHFLFQVNFSLLLESAPRDFGILQLVTSNEYSVVNLWKVFKRHGVVWVKRKSSDDYWCAGAYIINKSVMKPYIDAIITQYITPKVTKKKSWMELLQSYSMDSPTVSKETADDGVLLGFEIIAGYRQPCWPPYCCEKRLNHDGKGHPAWTLRTVDTWLAANATNPTNPSERKAAGPSCFNAARGYQADHFIFSLAPSDTYILSVPIISGAVHGNRSTMHQDHVSYHVSAFNRINSLSKELTEYPTSRQQNGTITSPLFPNFLNKHCRFSRVET